jgi:hypothetical protein
MSKVFVLDTNLRQLNPVHPGEARRLLSSYRAAIYRHYPFTIVLKTAVSAPIEPLRIKLDPGSKTTGIALVDDKSGEVVFAAELSHRGHKIKESLDSRRAIRRSRRQLSQTTMEESAQHKSRMASALFAKQDCQYPHMGSSTLKSLQHHKHQLRAGQVRYATPGKS